MVQSNRPMQERRKNERILPPKARAWLVNGQFEEILSTVNFCKKLLNLSPAGMCCETPGRLRVGVQMNAEIRFDDIGGSIRAPAKIIWVESVQQGGLDIHKAGLQFVGKVEMTKQVREFFGGRSAVSIVSERKAEYQDLKAKSTANRKPGPGKAVVMAKRTGVTLLVLLICYLGSFGVLVYRGRAASSQPGIHFRYAPPGSGSEETLAKIFRPLVQLFRWGGVDLVYDGAPVQEK